MFSFSVDARALPLNGIYLRFEKAETAHGTNRIVRVGTMNRPALQKLLAVIVAALLFAVSFIMINGLQIMTSRLLDARRTLIISLSVIAGMAVEVFPSIAGSCGFR